MWAAKGLCIMGKQWVIGLCVAAVYLAVSLLFHAWAWSWLIWVAYAAYRWFTK